MSKGEIHGLFEVKHMWPASANCYLLEDEDGAILIDVGCGKAGHYEKLKEFLASLSYAPGDIHTVVLTHAHPDHMGAMPFLFKESKPEVIIHQLEKPLAANPRLLNKTFDMDYITRFYMKRVPGAKPEDFEILDYFSRLCPMGSAKADTTVRDGDTLKLADRILEILHTPGHAPGHICLYERDEKILFSGDMIGAPVAWYCPSGGGVVGYLETLDKISSLEIEVIMPSHGNEIREVEKAIAKTRRALLKREERIIEMLSHGKASLLEIVDELFHDEASKFFPGLQMVDSHLLKLEKDGKVKRYIEDGMLFASLV